MFYAALGVWHTFSMPLRKLRRHGHLLPAYCERMDQNLVLLRRVAHHVAAFTWDASDIGQAYQPKPLPKWFPDYLGALQPEGLAALRLLRIESLPEGLGRLLQLTSLEIDSDSPARDAAPPIGQMTRLANLSVCIHPGSLSDGLLASVLQLTGLTSLKLSSFGPLPVAAAHVTRLTQLRHLSLTERVLNGQLALQVPLPTAFPAGLLSSRHFRSPALFQASDHHHLGHAAARLVAPCRASTCMWLHACPYFIAIELSPPCHRRRWRGHGCGVTGSSRRHGGAPRQGKGRCCSLGCTRCHPCSCCWRPCFRLAPTLHAWN